MGDGPTYVRSADGSVTGRVTGGTRPCRLAGCRGLQRAVRWPDGRLSYPCSMTPVTAETWQIG
jgi:hypothetical protein